MTATAKVTRKGQVTIPRQIREKLGSDVVEFVWSDGVITLRPVQSVAGALKRFARDPGVFAKEREMAWEEAAHERCGKKAD